MIRTTLFAAALAAPLAAPLAAQAQDLPTALAACADLGHNVSVAVVARDGATKVLLKADNFGPHTAPAPVARGSPRPGWAAIPPGWRASSPAAWKMPGCAAWTRGW